MVGTIQSKIEFHTEIYFRNIENIMENIKYIDQETKPQKHCF